MRFHSMIVRTMAVSMLIATGAASMSQTSQSTNIDPGEPRVQKAVALAALVGKSDFAAAIQYLQANAVPGSSAASNAAAQIEELQDRFASGGYAPGSIFQPKSEVFVMMMKEGEVPPILRIEVDQAEPFGIKAVRVGQSMTRARTP